MGQEAPHRPSLLRTVRAVAWSFLGVRRAGGLDEDARLHPLAVVAVGFVAVLLLVVGLMVLVHWIV